MRVALKIINCSVLPEKANFFMADGFPAVPAKDARIDVFEIVKDFCDEATAAEYDNLNWQVDHVFWCKDEKGIYPEIVCRCLEQPH